MPEGISGAGPAADVAPQNERPRTLNVRGATVLGVGSMVGAGIFSLLGEAGAIAGAAVWISFVVGGIVAGLLGYVCSKLGMRYPSSGGLITYLIEGFGMGRLVGVTAWLGYISAVVVVTAMVAVSFGGYAVSLFVGNGSHWSGWDNVFITGLLVVMCALNMTGARLVAAAQAAIVTGVLAVFGVFIVVTVPDIDTGLLAFDGYPSAAKILSSVALTFFAFLGFNVITFTAGDLKNPRRDLPRAMALSLGITTVVYVLIAIGVFGTLTVSQVIDYGPTAIAEAARPALGDTGFTIMAVAALLSTAGCTNATLYASDNLMGSLSETRIFPAWFGSGGPLGRHSGLLITTVLVLIIANLGTLGAIASVGSAVSMMVFVLIGLAGWRRRHDTGSNPAIVVASIILTLVVLGFFFVDTFRNAPETFGAIIAVGALAIVLDALFRKSPPPGQPALKET
jgi:amino acid transporter